MARRFGHRRVPRDHAPENRLVKLAPDLGFDLVGEICFRVVHCQQDPSDAKQRVPPYCLPDRCHELDKSLKRIVFALYRDQDSLRCPEGVLCQRPKRGRAVNKDDIEPSRLETFEVVAQTRTCQIPLSGPTLKVSSRRDAGDALPRRLDYASIGGGREDRAGIHGLGAHAAGGICLGVDVDDEDSASRQTEGVGKGGGGSRLTDAAFLIGDCEDAGHGFSLGAALYVVPGQGQQKTLCGSIARGYNLWRGRSTWNTALLGGRRMKIRTHVYYSGQVQGVGFRYTVERLARGQAVTGFVRNLRDGRVELVVEGEQADVGRFLDEVDRIMAGYIHNRLVEDEQPTGEFSGFEVAFGAI